MQRGQGRGWGDRGRLSGQARHSSLGQSGGRRPEGAVGAADRDAHAQPERIHAHAMKFMAGALIALFSVVAAAQNAGDEAVDQAAQQVERQQTQPLNNAPVWREVRSGVPAETAVIGRETNVLIQPTMKLPGLPAGGAGETWRPSPPPPFPAGGGPPSPPPSSPPPPFPPAAPPPGDRQN